MHRSWLFVPGNDERKVAKAFACGADALILDLEDSVATQDKSRAREITSQALLRACETTSALWVRINGMDTPFWRDDLAAIIQAKPQGIVLPKSRFGQDVEAAAMQVSVAEAEAGLECGQTHILAIATENATGTLHTATYLGCSPRLKGLTWGGEDLMSDIGALTNRDHNGYYTDVFRLARALCLLGATHAGVEAIDAVFPNFRDTEGLTRECMMAKRDGFTGKMAIHPDQVQIIHAILTPSTQEMAEAKAIVDAFAAAGHPGVLSFEGRMLDKPHLVRAQRLLHRFS